MRALVRDDEIEPCEQEDERRARRPDRVPCLAAAPAGLGSAGPGYSGSPAPSDAPDAPDAWQATRTRPEVDSGGSTRSQIRSGTRARVGVLGAREELLARAFLDDAASRSS